MLEELFVTAVEAKITGSLKTTGRASARAGGSINSNAGLIGSSQRGFEAEVSGEGNRDESERLWFHLLFPFTIFAVGGIDLDVTVSAEAGANSAHNGTASANFGSTLEITGFNFYDAQGNFLDGITVTGDSGTNYPVNVTIPEPSAIVLVALSLAALSIRRPQAQRYSAMALEPLPAVLPKSVLSIFSIAGKGRVTRR